MAFTEFYCDYTNGANINGGSDAGSPSMSDTAGTGTYLQGGGVTDTYTSVSTTGTVTTGQFISIYSGSATVPSFTARITAVSGGSGSVWTITVSNTAMSGTRPANASTYKAQVGGAWKGPNAAENHPFNYITAALTDAAGDYPRVNFNNNTTYSITAAITHGKTGPIYFQGMTSTPGDLGKATIDGGTSGASYILYTTVATEIYHCDMIFKNNGATSNAHGVLVSAGSCIFDRCVFNNMRGSGIRTATSGNVLLECEAYTCNVSNTSIYGGFLLSSGTILIRCVSHNNTTANSYGFSISVSGNTLIGCVADTNGGGGFVNTANSVGFNTFKGCIAYNNTGPGIGVNVSNQAMLVENCILSTNSTFGVNNLVTSCILRLINCSYYNNASDGSATTHQTNGVVDTSGAITLTGNPFTAAATGDFTLNNTAGAGAACRGAGRGIFTETATSYTGTVGYPDVGAAQSQATGGGGGGKILASSIIEGLGIV